MSIVRPRVSGIRYLCFVEIFAAIILDNVGAEDVTKDMIADIMLYRFIGSVFDVNTLGWDLQYKNKK